MKLAGLFSVFLAQKWNWLWFHGWNWLKLWNRPDLVGKKIETDGRGEAACRQFQFFFPTKFWTVSQFYASFHPWNHQPLSFFEPIKTVKQNGQFHPVFTWNCATSQNKNKCGFYWNLIFSIKQFIKSRAKLQRSIRFNYWFHFETATISAQFHFETVKISAQFRKKCKKTA